MSKESLSALLDGECRDAELDQLLDAMSRDPQLGETWSRLCLTRDARDGRPVAQVQVDIVSAVMQGIAGDPVPTRKVVEISAFRSRVRRFARPAVGFAAAASMGAAAVLALQLQPPANDAMPSQVAAASNASSGLAQPVSYDSGATAARYASDSYANSSYTTSAPTQLQTVSINQDPEQMQMLREYLINHSDSVSGHGVGGALYYTRFAAHTGQVGGAGN